MHIKIKFDYSLHTTKKKIQAWLNNCIENSFFNKYKKEYKKEANDKHSVSREK